MHRNTHTATRNNSRENAGTFSSSPGIERLGQPQPAGLADQFSGQRHAVEQNQDAQAEALPMAASAPTSMR